MERALDVLQGASQFFQTEFLPHLEEEERGMFLLLRDRLPRGSTLIYEVEAQYEQMRKLCERLREELSWLRHVKYRKPPMLADLQSLCAQLTGLLSQHAEREERLLRLHANLNSRFAQFKVEAQEAKAVLDSDDAHDVP